MSGRKVAASASGLASAALSLGGWATSAESVHPRVAPALYALAAIALAGAIILWVASDRESAWAGLWREQQARFDHLNKNVFGHYDRIAGSRDLRWSIWPREGASTRDRELFEAEAIQASRLLKKTLGYSNQKFAAHFGSHEVDQWLTAIRSLAHPGTDMQSGSRDSAGRPVVGQYLEELPVMSAVACAKLGTGIRPRVGLPSNLD